jgi:hypothetical protein
MHFFFYSFSTWQNVWHLTNVSEHQYHITTFDSVGKRIYCVAVDFPRSKEETWWDFELQSDRTVERPLMTNVQALNCVALLHFLTDPHPLLLSAYPGAPLGLHGDRCMACMSTLTFCNGSVAQHLLFSNT